MEGGARLSFGWGHFPHFTFFCLEVVYCDAAFGSRREGRGSHKVLEDNSTAEAVRIAKRIVPKGP